METVENQMFWANKANFFVRPLARIFKKKLIKSQIKEASEILNPEVFEKIMTLKGNSSE